MSIGPAPVAVFAYNRPDHLKRTLQSLIACEGADSAPITVFIDGPKNPDGREATEQVRQVASAILGEGADIRVAGRNRGLANSIVAGVNELLAAHGCVIVVEDDLELAPPFLAFMNEALERYRADEHVFQVTGYMFDIPEFRGRTDALFLPMVSTWGWATWSRAWESYDPNATGWEQLLVDRKLRKRFNLGGAYRYSWMMERQQRGQSDSWGIRWYWSVFQQRGMTLFPPVSMVYNAGQDGSGTHGGGAVADFNTKDAVEITRTPILPNNAIVKEADYDALSRSIWKQNGGWRGWLLQTIRQIMKK